jgi:hypothetical protein
MSLKRFLIAGGLGIVVGVVVLSIAYVILDAVTTQDNEPIGWLHVITAGIMGGFAIGILFAATVDDGRAERFFERRGRRGRAAVDEHGQTPGP